MCGWHSALSWLLIAQCCFLRAEQWTASARRHAPTAPRFTPGTAIRYPSINTHACLPIHQAFGPHGH